MQQEGNLQGLLLVKHRYYWDGRSMQHKRGNKKNSVHNINRKDPLKDLCADGRITVQWTLKK